MKVAPATSGDRPSAEIKTIYKTEKYEIINAKLILTDIIIL